jgi:hypothetical protein
VCYKETAEMEREKERGKSKLGAARYTGSVKDMGLVTYMG